MTPQLEEVLLSPHCCHLQHRAPQLRQQLFLRRLRPLLIFASHTQLCWRRQRFAVYFAVGCQRQLVQQHPVARHHVTRQPLRQVAPQLSYVQLCCSAHHIGHQPRLCAFIPAQQHHTLSHTRMTAQHCFYLAQLNAIAAQLHLLVQPPHILDAAIRSIAPQVTRAVPACSGSSAVAVRLKPLCRQLRPPQIPAPYSGAADIDLAHHPHRYRFLLLVQDVHLHVPQRLPNARPPTAPTHLTHRRIDRRLRWSIHVVVALLLSRTQLLPLPRLYPFPTQQHCAHAAVRLTICLLHQPPLPRRALQQLHLLPLQIAPQLRPVGSHLLRHHHHTPPAQ